LDAAKGTFGTPLEPSDNPFTCQLYLANPTLFDEYGCFWVYFWVDLRVFLGVNTGGGISYA
jgi:hypothetical protein